MGIVDKIKGFFDKKEKSKLADQKIRAVKDAAQESNYNEASKRAFYALEEFGKQYKGIERTVSTTAREYSKLLIETGTVTEQELEPLIYHFEIATYSASEVTFDDYRKIEDALTSVNMKLKKEGGRTQSKGSGRQGNKKRKRKSSGKGGAARGGSAAAAKRKARRRKK